MALPILRRVLLAPDRVSLKGAIAPTGRLEALHLRPREVSSNDSLSVGLREKVEALKSQEQVVVGIRVADSHGTSLAADLANNGTNVSYEIKGRSRQNEEGVEDVCKILVQRLNAQGSAWGVPTAPPKSEPEAGIDCVACDGTRKLQIQVTRAERKRSLWHRLASRGVAEDVLAVLDAAAALRAAIEHKAKKAPIRQRGEIVLVLDATETAGHTLDAVVAAFRKEHGAGTRALCYKEVWLVGPNPRLTSRLDHDEGNITV